MEVFMRNVPVDFSDKTLKKNLDPIISRLGIPIQAFICDKPRKLKWARVTFVEWGQGEQFLAAHGEEMVLPSEPLRQLPNGRRRSTLNSNNGATAPSISINGFGNGYHYGSFAYNHGNRGPNQRPRKVARLHLANHPIHCAKSKDPNNPNAVPGQPDPLTIRALRHSMEEAANPTRMVTTEEAPQVFQLISFSCGLNVFEDDKLLFVPEVEFQVTGTAKFSKRTLLIKLNNRQVIRIALERVSSAINSFGHTITLTLTEEPLFFLEDGPTPNDNDLAALMGLLAMESNNRSDKDTKRSRICSLSEQHASVLGHCLTYQLRFIGPDLPQKMRKLSHHETLSLVRYTLITQRSPICGFSTDSMDALHMAMQEALVGEKLPFAILFQLHALAANAYLHPQRVLELLKAIQGMYESDQQAGRQPISVEAMKLLFKHIGWPQPHGDPSEFELLPIINLLRDLDVKFRNDETVKRDLLSPTGNTASIHRVIVTPTRTILRGPELEAKNRIIRKFPEHHEYFIRVLFCDEDGDDLRFNANISLDQVWMRFKHVFQHGITVAGRVYSFLAFSHSSLRSHSAWFCASFVDNNGFIQDDATIIGGLGTFTHIRCPARCAARIGQAFSETPFALDLDEYGITVHKIKDVESSDGKRLFSDGVGTFSAKVMHKLCEQLPLAKGTPSAYQIRFRGSKGMVALDSRLEGSVICIRPSMDKFPSLDKNVLEICDMASKPIPLVLNRQMIKIMEDMGVDKQWFLNMQEIQLTKLQNVTSDTYSVAEFIKQNKVGDGIRLYRIFRHAANLGIDWRKDDFLSKVVSAALLRELRLLKHKARIPIWKGITLFGIMDETGYLKEKEVFITYDTMDGRYAPPPNEGRLLVTRSPALHPGDIQAAHFVVPPVGHPLHDLSNVIVFSRHGSRDLPSQLSGGDLDGDIYNVIWDENAMPQRTFTPADYPREPPMDLDRKVEKADMADFFVDFMKMDHLGVVATRHMIIADQKPRGTLEDDCKQLAKLHSTAVDFSKTGRPVDLKSLPRAHKVRPDFLGSGPDARIVDKSTIELDEYIYEAAPDEDEAYISQHKFEYYYSDKVLGHLYRAVDEQKVWKDVQSKLRPRGSSSMWDDIILATRPWYEAIVEDHQGYVVQLEYARDIRGWYEEAVANAMAQYSNHPIKPITELEVFIGSVVNKTGKPSTRQRDNNIKLRDEFDRISVWISRLIRNGPADADSLTTDDQYQHASLHLCLACVYAGCEKKFGHDGPDYDNMQSFKVVAGCAYLAELNRLRHGITGGGFVGTKSGGTGIMQNGAAVSSQPVKSSAQTGGYHQGNKITASK